MLPDIRAAADLMSSFDQLPEFRRLTRNTALAAFGDHSSRMCLICGRGKPHVKSVTAAHVVSLEEGGDTSAGNLVPLCDGTRHLSSVLADTLDWASIDQKRMALSLREAVMIRSGSDGSEIGCHKLYDFGVISRWTIRQVQSKKIADPSSVRRHAIEVTLKDLDSEFAPISSRRRLIKREWNRAEHAEPFSSDWMSGQCRLISIMRRLTSLTFLARARSLRDRILRGLDESHVVEPRLLSWFWYETALLAMVDRPRCDLSAAIDYLTRSRDMASVAGEEKSWAMSELELVHAELFAANSIGASVFESFDRRQARAIATLKRLAHGDENTCARWTMNGLMHRAQLQFKARRISEARKSLEKATAFRDNSSLGLGWGYIDQIHLAAIRAAVARALGNHLEVLQICARALRVMSAGRGKRPENVLDVMFCATQSLEATGRASMARAMESIATRISDGRSGFVSRQFGSVRELK